MQLEGQVVSVEAASGLDSGGHQPVIDQALAGATADADEAVAGGGGHQCDQQAVSRFFELLHPSPTARRNARRAARLALRLHDNAEERLKPACAQRTAARVELPTQPLASDQQFQLWIE